MLITDTFIEIGSQHKVCEDYIMSTEDPKAIIISDGCSSSKNTDMGARILSYLTRQELLYMKDFFNPDPTSFGHLIIMNAKHTAKDIGLNLDALDATLIISHYNPKLNNLSVYLYGDGYVITQDINNRVEISKIEYDHNTPYYLSYFIDEKRNQLYKEANIQQSQYKNNELISRVGAQKRMKEVIDLSDKQCVLVASDGLGSFIKKGDPVPIENFISNFLTYPVKNGQFLKRTMNHFLKKMKEEGIDHYDDLSIGAFLVKE